MNRVVKERMKAFQKGFASVFDLSGGTLMECREIPGGFERDRMMLAGDWARIGNDIRKTMDMTAREQ
jgi:hypothetical protein